MRVVVKMSGNLRRLLPIDQESIDLSLPSGSTMRDVIQRLAVPEGELGVAAVNGQTAPETVVLHDGDLVELFAVMAGGFGRAGATHMPFWNA